jgi:ArsR family transcriptional regulator, lead/cadmium/zinc/bismuth-responsive transcriptional repressor
MRLGMKKKKGEHLACASPIIHRDRIRKVRSIIPDRKELETLADLFKSLGDLTRINILHALSISEMCVCDLSNLLGMQQSAISHQLKILRLGNLVKSRKAGKVVYYTLADEHVKGIFALGMNHVVERGK